MKRAAVFALLAAILAVGLAGCGEREQTASYKDGRYRGKPDGRPWDSQPPSYVSGGWVKGDRETWEGHLKSRQGQSQNEDRRIGD